MERARSRLRMVTRVGGKKGRVQHIVRPGIILYVMKIQNIAGSVTSLVVCINNMKPVIPPPS
jgi:hypothetical protein